jgi:hypothetical protein
VTDGRGTVLTRLPAPGDPSAKPDLTLDVETRPGGPPGFQGIVYRNKSVELRGFVAAKDYAPKPDGDGISLHGFGWGDGGGMSDTDTAELRPGTPLLDEEGAPVGKVKDDTTLYLQGRAPKAAKPGTLVAGWVHVTGIGFVTVRARVEDLRPR